MICAPDHAPVCRELTADEIGWDLPPAPAVSPPEDEDGLIVALLIDVESYRRLAREAIHALHVLTMRYERLREAHGRLLDERRATS